MTGVIKTLAARPSAKFCVWRTRFVTPDSLRLDRE